jgi:hypothetical protein
MIYEIPMIYIIICGKYSLFYYHKFTMYVYVVSLFSMTIHFITYTYTVHLHISVISSHR